MEIGLIILLYFVMVLIGTFSLWLIGILFSGDPMGLDRAFVGALIVEFIYLFPIPLVPIIVLLIVLIKIGNFSGIPAFFASIMYGVMKMLLAMSVIGFVTQFYNKFF